MIIITNIQAWAFKTMTPLRNSKQRDIIRQALMNRTDHPTAETIYAELKPQYPRLSLGTVYRNLMLLKNLGEIQSIDIGDGVTHFDYDIFPHAHFLCSRCGRVSDIKIRDIERIKNSFSRDFKGRITTCNVNFIGICPECLNEENNDKEQ